MFKSVLLSALAATASAARGLKTFGLGSSSAASAFSVSASSTASAPPVRVELYYQSQCPGCQDFILTTLAQTLALPGISQIVNLVMVPFGTTRQLAGNEYSCPHGDSECQSNLYGLCLTNRLGGVGSISASSRAFPYFVCMEENNGSPSAAADCFSKSMRVDFSWDDIRACAADPESAAAMQAAGAAATPADLQYAPWLIVDGKQMPNPDPLLAVVCASYTGAQPEACKLHGVHTNPDGSALEMSMLIRQASPRQIDQREMRMEL